MWGSGLMSARSLTSPFRFAELCARGDLNSSKRRNIGMHRGTSEAILSAGVARRRLPSSTQVHLDTRAAGSRAGSQTLLSAARSPPSDPMH